MIPRRGAVALVLTAIALVLLLSFKTPALTGVIATGGAAGLPQPTPAAASTPAATATPGTSGTLGTGGGGVLAPTQVPTAGPSPGGASAGDGSYTGAAVQTPYGIVQVRITLSGGRITDVTALQLPEDRRRSAQISQYAAPLLRSEVVSAQSASIDTVSGATYTSEGYEQSLQSALDQAHG